MGRSPGCFLVRPRVGARLAPPPPAPPTYSEASGEKLRSARAEDRALRAALRRRLAFEHLLDDQQRAAFASSLKGKGYNVLGYVFSGYCVYKVVFACRAIVLKGGAAIHAHRRRVRRLLRRHRRRRHRRGGERRERGERGGGDGGGGGGGGGEGGRAPRRRPPARTLAASLVEYWRASGARGGAPA